MRSVDEAEHRGVGTAQVPGAVDDGPEHQVEIGRRSPHRRQHRVGGDDLFSGVEEVALELFDRGCPRPSSLPPRLSPVALPRRPEAAHHRSRGTTRTSPAISRHRVSSTPGAAGPRSCSPHSVPTPTPRRRRRVTPAGNGGRVFRAADDAHRSSPDNRVWRCDRAVPVRRRRVDCVQHPARSRLTSGLRAPAFCMRSPTTVPAHNASTRTRLGRRRRMWNEDPRNEDRDSHRSTATCGSVTQPPRCSQMQARQRPQRAWGTERANQDADIAGRECGVTKGGKVWRQFANDFANESVENSTTLANTGRHESARRVLSSLLDDHVTSSDNTGRTARLTLSRWRHGFESRTGCQ